MFFICIETTIVLLRSPVLGLQNVPLLSALYIRGHMGNNELKRAEYYIRFYHPIISCHKVQQQLRM